MQEKRLDQRLYVARLRIGQLIESLLTDKDPHACLREQVPSNLQAYRELLDVLAPDSGTDERAVENMAFLTDLANHQDMRSYLELGPTLPVLSVSTKAGKYELVLSAGLRFRGEGSYYGVGLEESYWMGFIRRKKFSTEPKDMFDEEWVDKTWVDMEKVPRANWNHTHLLVRGLSQHDSKSLLVQIRKNV